MTPAEQLSLHKKRQRPKRNGPPKIPRTRVWKTRLREIREGVNLAIRDVADAVGMGITSYWQIENGTDPMLSNAVKIAEFFGTTVESIWSKRAAKEMT